MRVSGPAQEYLTQSGRLKRFYGAVTGKVTSPARPGRCSGRIPICFC